MATVVDSTQEPLPAPSVLSMAAAELDLKGITVEAAMVGLAHEMSLPDVDLVQVGNTVFVGHRGKGKSKNKMAGRVFNVDTARNLVNNCVKYLSVLQEKGVTHYSVDFEGRGLVPVAKAVGKLLPELGMSGSMAEFKNGKGHRLYFLLQPKTEKAAT